jgi:hypothetical protein
MTLSRFLYGPEASINNDLEKIGWAGHEVDIFRRDFCGSPEKKTTG